MATADWPEDWPWEPESSSKQEEDEEEDERALLTEGTVPRIQEDKEAPEHGEMPELENIPDLELDSVQASVASSRYGACVVCTCVYSCVHLCSCVLVYVCMCMDL